MPGENCAVWGCGSCRRTKGLGIFKLPAAKDPEHKTWREAWLGEITKTREKNAEFQTSMHLGIMPTPSEFSGRFPEKVETREAGKTNEEP